MEFPDQVKFIFHTSRVSSTGREFIRSALLCALPCRTRWSEPKIVFSSLKWSKKARNSENVIIIYRSSRKFYLKAHSRNVVMDYWSINYKCGARQSNFGDIGDDNIGLVEILSKWLWVPWINSFRGIKMFFVGNRKRKILLSLLF